MSPFHLFFSFSIFLLHLLLSPVVQPTQVDIPYVQYMAGDCEKLICDSCEIIVEEFGYEISTQAKILEKNVFDFNNLLKSGDTENLQNTEIFKKNFTENYIDSVFTGDGSPFNGFCQRNKRISKFSEIVFDVCDQFNNEVSTLHCTDVVIYLHLLAVFAS